MDPTPARELQDWLRTVARKHVGPAVDVDDIVQETLLIAMLSQFRGVPPKPWLARVVRNLAWTHRRGKRRRREREATFLVSTAAELQVESPEEQFTRVQEAQALTKHVAALPEPYRSAVVARYYVEACSHEIGAAKGVPAGTIRRWLLEARARLRRSIEAESWRKRKQEARSKKQEARSKKQEARSKKQEARSGG